MKRNHNLTFPKGGVHPPDNKLTAHQAIEELSLPSQVFIPIAQHIGVPATSLVKVTDTVLTGQLIARSEGFVSTNIHSSVTGKVKKIDDLMDSSGYKQKTIIIDVEDDIWEAGIDSRADLNKDIQASQSEIISKILEAGIVGMGGATFPSHVKLTVPEGKKAEFLIINGVECEPFLTADHRLMLEKGAEIIIGIELLKRALNVKTALIGIESNKPDAIQNLRLISQGYKGIEIYPLKVQYPQGAEKQLIEAVVNRQVPSGGLPIDVGCVVHNVATAYAVYEAVQKNKPLIERVVTVTGPEVKKPRNFLVRLGTPISFLIEKSGGLPTDTGKIISGGPMMGKALTSAEISVTKGTSGILLFPEDLSRREDVQNCIRCAKCIAVCPLRLQPYLLMSLSQKLLLDRVEKEHVLDCCECGSCSYICPSNRPLLDYIRLGKNRIMQKRKAPK